MTELQSLLLNSIDNFEFPRVSFECTINDFVVENDEVDDTSFFHEEISVEEQNILAHLMASIWLQRQISSIENIRMKYSGSDFKMTSQASHLQQLIKLGAE